MAYRPHPSAARARHQLDRHARCDAPTTTIAGVVTAQMMMLSRVDEGLRAAHPGMTQAMANIASTLSRMSAPSPLPAQPRQPDGLR